MSLLKLLSGRVPYVIRVSFFGYWVRFTRNKLKKQQMEDKPFYRRGSSLPLGCCSVKWQAWVPSKMPRQPRGGWTSLFGNYWPKIFLLFLTLIFFNSMIRYRHIENQIIIIYLLNSQMSFININIITDILRKMKYLHVKCIIFHYIFSLLLNLCSESFLELILSILVLNNTFLFPWSLSCSLIAHVKNSNLLLFYGCALLNLSKVVRFFWHLFLFSILPSVCFSGFVSILFLLLWISSSL